MSLFEHKPHPHVEARKQAGPVKASDHFAYLGRINETLARRGTLAFGSMWCFYLFVLYGLLPLEFPNAEIKLLYWSNVIQMAALPLLMVGAVVLGRAGDERNKQAFDDTEAILHGQQQGAAHLAIQDAVIGAMAEKLGLEVDEITAAASAAAQTPEASA